MKRILISGCIIALCLTIAFGGCGNKKKETVPEKSIKIVQTSGGGIVFMPKIIINDGGVAYASDMVLDINQGYVLYLRHLTPASFPRFDVYIEDDEGNRLDDTVDLVVNKEAPYVDCIGVHDLQHVRGVQFSAQQTRPGRCKIIAVSGELTREIDFLIFDGYGAIPPGTGMKVSDAGHSYGSEAESAIYEHPTNGVMLPGRSYLVNHFPADDYVGWRAQMKNIKTVDTSRMGAEGYYLKKNDICVAECPGGHVKVTYIEDSIIWEFKPLDRAEFR